MAGHFREPVKPVYPQGLHSLGLLVEIERAIAGHEADRLAGLSARTEATREKRAFERAIADIAKARLLPNIET